MGAKEFRIFRNVKFILKRNNVTFISSRQIGSVFLERSFLLPPNDPFENLNLSEFPNAGHLWMKFYRMKLLQKYSKEVLLEELLDECGINVSSLPLKGFEMRYLLNKNTEILKRLNIINSHVEVTDRLLSQLEPFPFDNQELEAAASCSGDGFTIALIKNSIEKQYLAWKFNSDLRVINAIYNRLQVCMLTFSSLKSMVRTLDLMSCFRRIKNESISSKIFILQIKPLTVECLYTFKNNVVGIPWDVMASKCPCLMRRSYYDVLLVVDILKSKGFSDAQIKVGLPFIRVNFSTFIKRLDYILSEDRFRPCKEEKDFLRLIVFSRRSLGMFVSEGRTFKDIQLLITPKFDRVTWRLATKHISYLLVLNSLFEDDILATIKRHPKLRLSSETQVQESVNFLLGMNFTLKEIRESITIVLYPREVIQEGLSEVKRREKILRTLGFENGCVREETKLFTRGTKLRNKTLQLCLYFIEKEYSFTGEGVLKSD